MKHLFTLLSLFLGLNAMAQLPVSQTQQKKKIIIEEFNGIHCQYCPDGHRISSLIQEANPGNVIVYNVHTSNLATPSTGEPDFRTDYGSPLINQTSSTGLPTATINRHVFSGTATGISRGSWESAANTIKLQDAYVNVALEAEIDVQTNTLTVNVELYYTGNSPESSNFLNVILTQSDIRGVQDGLSDNPTQVDEDGNYIHDHALREMITGLWGDSIMEVTSGSLVEKTYTYDLPASFRNIPVDFADLEVIAFVTETRQETINGSSYHPKIVNFANETDGNLEDMRLNAIDCDNEIKSKVQLRNNGNNDITSATFEYKVNGGDAEVLNWNGGPILPGYAEEISLPNLDYDPIADNNLEIIVSEINDVTDEVSDNNTIVKSFNQLHRNDGVNYHLKLTTDRYASETSWTIKDENGSVLHSSPNYPDLAASGTVTREYYFVLEKDECYTFEIKDSYGDGICGGYGAGQFELSAGAQVISTGCDFGNKTSFNFSTEVSGFSLETNSAFGNYGTDEGDPTVYNVLTPDDVPITLKWHLIDLDVPTGWTEEVAVCDAIECHLSTLTEYEYDITVLEGTPLDVHFINNNELGDGQAIVLIYEVADSANTAREVYFNVSIRENVGVFNQVTQHVEVYPNPTSNNLSIVGLDQTKVDQIQIYSVLGDLVKTVSTTNQDINTIDVSNLVNGMYLIKMYDQKNDLYLTQSFLKQ